MPDPVFAEQELAALWHVAEALNRSREVAEALSEVLERVCDLLGLQGGWAWVRAGPGGPFELMASHRLPQPLVDRPGRMRGCDGCSCLDHYLARPAGRPANINIMECSRLADLVPRGAGARSHASVPLFAGGRLLGVMNVLREDWSPLREDELRLLETVAHQAAVACERAMLAEAATQAVRTQERNALAREIHDSLAQDLAGLVLQLEAAEARECEAVRDGGAGECLPHLRRALDLARQAMAAARRSVVQLREGAPGNGSADLREGLHALAKWAGSLGAALDVRLAPDARPDAETAATLLAIAREALANAVRHGGARRVTLTVAAADGWIRATVADDGLGFDPARAGGAPGHFGLVGMRERVRASGGSLRIQSRRGRGCRVTVRLPAP
jgi:two-component system NarL family sensor kinase